MSEVFISHGESDTEEFAKNFAKKLKKGDTVSFYGDLGAGKTAFVRGACSYLCPDAFVCSPTYALLNEYTGADFTVCHYDLYRITSGDDLYSIGFDDNVGTDKIVFTEWSENVENFLPLPRYEVKIEKGDGDNRTITVSEKK